MSSRAALKATGGLTFEPSAVGEDHTALFRSHEKFADLAAATTPWREMNKLAERLGAASTLTHQLSRMSKFDGGLRHALSSPACGAWSAHLKAMAIPTTAVLAYDWPSPIALIAELQAPDLGASVSWLARRRDEPLLMTAALTHEAIGDAGDEFVVDGDPVCAICGGPLKSFDSTVRWIGPKKGIRSR